MDIKEVFNSLPELDRLQLYISHVSPVVNRLALFADGTDFYRHYTKTEDGYSVRLRFRTARGNAEKVILVTDTIRVPLHKFNSDDLFDYFEVEVDYPACGTEYYFEIISGKTKAVYNKRGAMDGFQTYYNFHFRPDFHTPDWAKGAVFYQIFVDRFKNGDKSNDVVNNEYNYIHQHASLEKDWSAFPKKLDVCHFYGGDLQGVMDELDYLQGLGVEVLYLNPIFVSPSNHKYDIQDYDYVDPHYGKIVKDYGELLTGEDENNQHATRYMMRVTDKENLEASNQFFIQFVEEVHRRGMRIILDGVFNHCGSFNKWMDRERIYQGQKGYQDGAYISEESPYADFFQFHSSEWPYNKDYDGWWGHNTLPKLNYEQSDRLYQYILDIGKKWVSPPFNCDGWRLDVAADLGHSDEFNHRFWKDFRKAVKEANPEALILAENYTDPALWLQGDEWDTVMNYEAFMDPISWFLTGTEKHNDSLRPDLLCNFESFRDAMTHHMSRFPHEALYVAMNELSNHDHSRFLTRTNGKVGRTETAGPEAAMEGCSKAQMREAVIMQMTWPGAPTVYYGDEAGVYGWTDPDNRRTYPWGEEDQQMIHFHRDVIRIHNNSTALRTGSLKILGGSEGVLYYSRFDQNEIYVVVVNNLDSPQTVEVPVWQAGVTDDNRMEQLILSREKAYSRENKTFAVKDGRLTIIMQKKSAVILRCI